MLKYVYTVFFLIMSMGAFATDLPYFDVSMTFAADSTDTVGTIMADTAYSDSIPIIGWEKVAFNWQVNLDNDSAFTDDTLWLQLQSALAITTDNYGSAYSWTSVSGGDETILIGGNDTSNAVFTSLIITDSMFNYLRCRAIYHYTTSGTDTADLAGNTYIWHIKPWIDKKFK
jgi:hypothetical protein